ncbi:hypothetical protein KY347_02020 [Candidatus Woesearchaeota archaeon]|nr:hypothetical protein [Candidatus Woesearchaeota archaeon]
MKKIILVLILLLFIIGCTQQEGIPIGEELPEISSEEDIETLPITAPEEEIIKTGLTEGTEDKVVCEDYDNNQEGCLLHSECRWDSDENLCDPIGRGGDEDYEDTEEIIDDGIIKGEFQYDSPWVIEGGKRIDDSYFWDVCVVEVNNGKYRMYGEKGTKILSYISNDGLLWEKEAGVRFEGGGFPQVMKTDEGKWRMFYVPSGISQQNKFLSAISSDGLNFVKEEGERYSAESNIEKKIQGPRIIQLEDSTYRMYFTAFSSPDTKDETVRILSATSDDGYNFVKEDGIRLDPNSEPFVGKRVAHAFPLILDNGDIQLFFAGATNEGGGVLSAVSENGLDFTVNPYPEIEETFIEGEGIRISPQDPYVISMDGTLRMYYGLYKGSEVVDDSAIYSAVNNE